MTIQQAFELALQHHQSGRLNEAETLYRQIPGMEPRHADALHLLGVIAHQAGQNALAVDLIRQAIDQTPDSPFFYSNLGEAHRALGQLDKAIAAYHQAIVIKPDFAQAHSNLGFALHGKGLLDEAIAACRQAIIHRPTYSEAYNNLGNALNDKGQPDEAIAAYRQAIALQPDLSIAQSNLLFTLNYHPGMDARAIAEEHRGWSLRQFIQPHANERSPCRRLRVGYESPDFRDHSVAYFLEGLLEKHDRAQVEVFCYSDVVIPDAVTARLEQSAGHWRKIKGLPDAQVAELIRKDGIDILVDLAGHTASNRLRVFACKPAPVQVTWLGYPNTTGLDTIDYRLSDAFADPRGSSEDLHTEQLVRLPESAWCFRPSEHSPPVNAPPVHDTGHITFGCFNAMPKINGALLELWSRILLAVPDSRLLLKNKALEESSVRQRVRTALEEAGISPDRVEVLGRVPELAGHLASYGRVDIALDTFPYHGTTTTCEALWMGVPMVTLAGMTHCSRVGVSLLSNVGLPEWVAASPEKYVDLAVDLATDLPRLAHLRGTLRERMQASPLMDAAGFARNIEAAYREMWRTWCADQASSLPA